MTNYKEYRQWNKRKEDLVKLAETDNVLKEQMNFMEEYYGDVFKKIREPFVNILKDDVDKFAFDFSISFICIAKENGNNSSLTSFIANEKEEIENKETEKRLIEENRIREIVRSEIQKINNEPCVVYITGAGDVPLKEATSPDEIDKLVIVGNVISLVAYTFLVMIFTQVLSDFLSKF